MISLTLTRLFTSVLQSTKETLLCPTSNAVVCIREASKKASGSSRNPPRNTRPKHRGWKRQDGGFVQQGTILVTQLSTRFHSGLNVGFGRNGTLFAMEAGKVMVTCEKINPNWEHSWIKRNYQNRQSQVIYKKHFNVIPEPQHNRFKLVDSI